MFQPGQMKCTYCGLVGLEQGFVPDADQGWGGTNFLRWAAGPMRGTRFGGARWWNRTLYALHAFRCPRCQHVELFIGDSP